MCREGRARKGYLKMYLQKETHGSALGRRIISTQRSLSENSLANGFSQGCRQAVSKTVSSEGSPGAGEAAPQVSPRDATGDTTISDPPHS